MFLCWVRHDSGVTVMGGNILTGGKILNISEKMYAWEYWAARWCMVDVAGPGHYPGARLFFLGGKRIFTRDDISQPALQLEWSRDENPASGM